MASPYQSAGGTLKLKGIGDLGSKKKKKQKKISKEVIEQFSTTTAANVDDAEDGDDTTQRKDRRTPAQIAFAKIQEKRQTQRILVKAEKKHKDRVNEFNTKLDTLTEHFDIPKVSWTK